MHSYGPNLINLFQINSQKDYPIANGKNHILPTPLGDLFIVNNIRHDYFIRQHNDLHIDIGLKESVYKLFSFHGIHIFIF